MTVHPHERRDPNHPLRRVKDYTPDGQRRRRWSGPERAYRLSYRRRPLVTLLSTIVAIILPATLVYAGTSLSVNERTPDRKGAIANQIDVKWSDGNTSVQRTFDSSDYQHNPDTLPSLVIHVPPANVGVMYLQFQQDGEWDSEWVTKPDANGNATMPIDPTCQDGDWCNGSYKYRLKMGNYVTYLNLDYWDR